MYLTDLIKNGKHFCILPWIHFHSWPDGRVMPCCVADSSNPVSKITPNESIIQMLNSKEYREMRMAMIEDKPVATCQRCYDLEKLGTFTLRQAQNDRRGIQFTDLVEKTNIDGSIGEFKMAYMDVRFSNLCNMKCRSCGPSCSSQWANEFIEFKGKDVLTHYFNIDKMVVNVNEDGSFMKKLNPYLKNVEEVYFAGGEIVITPEHYECLDYWIEHGINEHIELSYTTNLSVLKYKDKDLINYWKQFPKLQIWASLDAYGDVAEVIRCGTDWVRIVKNIKELKELVPHANIQITPTISIWNVFSFPKFLDHMIAEGLISKDARPRFNIATNPWYANIMILPEKTSSELIKLYDEYIEKYMDNPFIVDGLSVIQQTLKSGNPMFSGVDKSNKGGIQEFIKFNNELDERRNEKLIEIIPELKEVYEWANS